jgi:hypothetical protein
MRSNFERASRTRMIPRYFKTPSSNFEVRIQRSLVPDLRCPLYPRKQTSASSCISQRLPAIARHSCHQFAF